MEPAALTSLFLDSERIPVPLFDEVLMAFSDDPITETRALLASSHERIRLTRLLCCEMRECCIDTAIVIQKSHATLLQCDEALDLYGTLRAPRGDGGILPLVDEATTLE